jgi:hypothetical protein
VSIDFEYVSKGITAVDHPMEVGRRSFTPDSRESPSASLFDPFGKTFDVVIGYTDVEIRISPEFDPFRTAFMGRIYRLEQFKANSVC